LAFIYEEFLSTSFWIALLAGIINYWSIICIYLTFNG